MRLIVFFILSCLIFSCKDEAEIGVGTDPELNIQEYTFSNKGGSLEVYSQIGTGIQFFYEPAKNSEYDPSVEINEGIDGGWFKVNYVIGDEYKYGTRICIEVGANDTGKERIVPVAISSYNYPCHVMYKQEK